MVCELDPQTGQGTFGSRGLGDLKKNKDFSQSLGTLPLVSLVTQISHPCLSYNFNSQLKGLLCDLNKMKQSSLRRRHVRTGTHIHTPSWISFLFLCHKVAALLCCLGVWPREWKFRGELSSVGCGSIVQSSWLTPCSFCPLGQTTFTGEWRVLFLYELIPSVLKINFKNKV